MNALYTATVQIQGGRSGHATSEDGLLDLSLAPPKALGGSGNGVNPEELFAAGYGACFASAIQHVAKQQSLHIDQVNVNASVSLHKQDTGFKLSVTLAVTIAGIDARTAEELVNKAHEVCPYSNAVRGNIEVQLKVNNSM